MSRSERRRQKRRQSAGLRKVKKMQRAQWRIDTAKSLKRNAALKKTATHGSFQPAVQAAPPRSKRRANAAAARHAPRPRTASRRPPRAQPAPMPKTAPPMPKAAPPMVVPMAVPMAVPVAVPAAVQTEPPMAAVVAPAAAVAAAEAAVFGHLHEVFAGLIQWIHR